MRRLAHLLALAALAAGLAAGCGGGETASGEPISFEQLAQSAEASADATTARFSFSLAMTMPGAGEELSFSGEGAVDQASGRASMSLDMSSFAALLGGLFSGLGGTEAPDFDDPDGWRIEAVRDGSVTYVRFPAIAGELPAGKTWVRTEDGSSVTADVDLSSFTDQDPRELLDVLKGGDGEVETVGTVSLRGVETTHYRIEIDPSGYEGSLSDEDRAQLDSFVDQFLEGSGLTKIPVDLWMDADGLVRKMVMSFSAAQPGTDDEASVSVSFEIWDYGEEITIDLPPADEVADASALED